MDNFIAEQATLSFINTKYNLFPVGKFSYHHLDELLILAENIIEHLNIKKKWLGLNGLYCIYTKSGWIVSSVRAPHDVPEGFYASWYYHFELFVEIARKELYNGRSDTLTYRRPILVSSSFGLLHGFGFAAVLSDIGLPQTELVTGLLFFNIGVELGQVAFALACFVVAGIFMKVSQQLPQRIQLGSMVAAIYAIGILSSYWVIDRGLSAL